MKYIIRPAATLFITAVISIALLSVVYNYTLEPIQMQRKRMHESAMREILPHASDFQEIPVEKTGSIIAAYEAIEDGDVIGYIVELSPKGYSGHIDLVVGISTHAERISGVRILRQTETPGLGALAIQEDFYRRFDYRPLIPLGVVRVAPGENEINALTAATITSKAVTDAVNEAIVWYQGGSGR